MVLALWNLQFKINSYFALFIIIISFFIGCKVFSVFLLLCAVYANSERELLNNRTLKTKAGCLGKVSRKKYESWAFG